MRTCCKIAPRYTRDLGIVPNREEYYTGRVRRGHVTNLRAEKAKEAEWLFHIRSGLIMQKREIAGDRPRLNFQQVRRIVANAGSILKRHAKFEGQPSKCVEVVCFSDSVYLSHVI